MTFTLSRRGFVVGVSLLATAGTALAASAANAFKYTMPAQSISVIELTP